jgi:type IV pilus assembly protein PilN
LFDELVKTIPASARLTGVKQDGQSMSLDGVSQSNASVAEYMKNIEASPWLGHTELRKTEKSAEATRMPYTFGLDIALSRPKPDQVADAGVPAGASSAPPPASAPAPARSATAPAGAKP